MDIPNMQNAGSLVVLGSINADHILNLQSFPTPGETVTGNHYQVAFGGKGANQAVAAGRSGANIAFIACTGDDSIGESVRQQLATDNIDITPVSVIKGESTGVALIFVNGEGENVIGIHAGANAALSPALVEAQRERIANASALLMQLESPLESVMAAAKIAHQNKTIVALNPAPARELPDELLALVDIITPNETEAEKLTGIRVENDEDAAKAAQVLHEKGIRTLPAVLPNMYNASVLIADSGRRFSDYKKNNAPSLSYTDLVINLIKTGSGEGFDLISQIAREVGDGVAHLRRIARNQNLSEIQSMRITGGQGKNSAWVQFKSSAANIAIEVPECADSELIGDAVFAGVGSGLFSSVSEGAAALVRIAHVYEPRRMP